jgi:biotin carboxyl carrier protein
MKMENRVSAPCAGEVLAIHGIIGETIRCKDRLAVIGPD